MKSWPCSFGCDCSVDSKQTSVHIGSNDRPWIKSLQLYWLDKLTSHTTQNRSFRTSYFQPISWLNTEKLNLTQQNPASICNKYTTGQMHLIPFNQQLQRKGKERKSIYIAPFVYYLYLKALRITQFYLQIHHACLSFVGVPQMAPPLTEVRDIQLQLTTHLSTTKGWKAELAWLVDQVWWASFFRCQTYHRLPGERKVHLVLLMVTHNDSNISSGTDITLIITIDDKKTIVGRSDMAMGTGKRQGSTLFSSSLPPGCCTAHQILLLRSISCQSTIPSLPSPPLLRRRGDGQTDSRKQ